MKKFFITKVKDNSEIKTGDLTTLGLIDDISSDKVSIRGSLEVFNIESIDKIKIELWEHIDKPKISKDSTLYHQIPSIKDCWDEYEENEKKQIKINTRNEDYGFWLSKEFVTAHDFKIIESLYNNVGFVKFAIPEIDIAEEKEKEMWYEILEILNRNDFPNLKNGDQTIDTLRNRFILKERKI